MFSSTDQMLPYQSRPLMIDRRWKPGVELAPNCPRCNSSNTKFCYYNNYSLTQPRYFCKGCRRYWTKGGSLRNVPVGGGCRKHRRAKSMRISSAPVGAREVSHARQRPPSPLRPDLVLDEIVGSTSHMNGSSSISLLDVSSSNGSSIDLAELYAKFLNQSPAVIDPVLAVPELPVEIAEPFGLDSSYQMPVQLLDQYSFGECQKAQEPIPEAMVNNELNFCLDPSGFEPLAFPVEGAGGDMFSSSYSIVPSLAWQAPKHQEFGSVTGDDNIVSHQNPPIGDWATLDQPSFDAPYTPLV